MPRRLVEKTEIIRKQLGSASPVIETRISELLAGGIDRQNADRVVAEIDRIEQSDNERRARDDLEPVREADARLTRRIEQLRSQLDRSRRRVGVDRVQLRRVVTFGLRLAGAPPLYEAETETGPQRFEFHTDEVAAIRDEGLGRIIGALREPTDQLGERGCAEAASLRALIEAQRQRIERELGRLDDPQYRLDLDMPDERRQRELDVRAWRGRLAVIGRESEEQPARILAGYKLRARRLEPVGIIYLWPATG